METAFLQPTPCTLLPLMWGVGAPNNLQDADVPSEAAPAIPLLTSPSRLNHIFKNAIVPNPVLRQEADCVFGSGLRHLGGVSLFSGVHSFWELLETSA